MARSINLQGGRTWFDKDPELEVLIAAILNDPRSLYRISEDAKVAYTTIKCWVDGKTKKPQGWTQRRVWDALGYDSVKRHRETGEILVIPVGEAKKKGTTNVVWFKGKAYTQKKRA